MLHDKKVTFDALVTNLSLVLRMASERTPAEVGDETNIGDPWETRGRESVQSEKLWPRGAASVSEYYQQEAGQSTPLCMA